MARYINSSTGPVQQSRNEKYAATHCIFCAAIDFASLGLCGPLYGSFDSDMCEGDSF